MIFRNFCNAISHKVQVAYTTFMNSAETSKITKNNLEEITVKVQGHEKNHKIVQLGLSVKSFRKKQWTKPRRL